MRESDLTRDVLVALSTTGLVRAWRQNASAGERGGRPIRGVPAGAADISGLILGSGRRLEIETKAAHRDACACRSCARQRAWGAMITAAGGLYLRVRSVDDAIDRVRAAAKVTC